MTENIITCVIFIDGKDKHQTQNREGTVMKKYGCLKIALRGHHGLPGSSASWVLPHGVGSFF